MVFEAAAPSVSGISPAEGPPGTTVKIRGENLGVGSKDIIAVYICNVNCTYTAEWQHSGLIHARTGMGLGMGDIIVATKSGGMGTSLVKFRGYMPRVGLLTEAAVWVDESKLFEEKPTTTLTNSRNYSQNSTYTDPLGVAPEETGAVLPADKIEEWYPESSSNPLSEKFNPSRFLLERHLDTSFDALKSGYYHLQSQDTRTSVGPSSFVRGNLTTILDSLFTLTDVQKSMLVHESESVGGNICEELQGVLKSCNFVSNSLFKDILSRKDEADAKRNVLNVLHRYRFLFNLPRSIEKNIQQGEYEILISDYNRAKALFQNTEVKSFKKALSEVDQKIAAFSTQLKHKLFDFPTPLEEQKKLIRYLNDLDYQGNAGWECIQKQTLWIKSMLLDCQVEHQGKEETNKLMTPPNSSLDIRQRPNDSTRTAFTHKRTPSETSNFSFTRSHSRSASLPESLRRLQSEQSNTPQGVLMIEELCKLISANLSELWNLGQTYISNQLGDKREASSRNDEREHFQALVKDVIVVYCEMVESVLQRDDRSRLTASQHQSKYLIPWLPGVVRSIWTTLQKLSKLGIAADVILPLKSLTTNAICDCIKKVLSSAVEDTRALCKQENWELEYDRRHSYWISKLPSMFDKIFSESIRFVHDFMTDSKIDKKSENHTVHNDVVTLLKTMLEAFLLSLERTVFPDQDNAEDQNDTMEEEQQEILTKDMRVIVLLSNCHHIKHAVIPNLVEMCMKYGYEEIKQFSEVIEKTINELDKRVYGTYIELKGEPLVGGIELGINMAEYKWDGSQHVVGVRPYIQDILIKYIVVHKQISSVSPLFTKRVFVTLIELVVDELQRIFACIDKYSAYGALQAHLELNAFKEAVTMYITEKNRSNIDSIIQKLPTLEEKNEKKKITLLTQFKETMRYQLASFGSPSDHVTVDSKETLKNRSSSSNSAGIRSRTQSNEKQQRDRSKSKSKVPKKKQSWGAQVEVEKSPPAHVQEQTLPKVKELIDNKKSEPTEPSTEAKKTKRRAPPPPQVLSGKTHDDKPQSESTNPFLEEESNSNPFLDDNEPEEPGNPFLDDEV